jgi:hypothetical protein
MRKFRKIAVALILALGVAACSQAPADDRLVADIKAKYFSDPQLKSAGLQVTSQRGEVTLSGEVPSEAARYQAFKLALDTTGVKKVNDQMTVRLADAVPPSPESKPEPAPAPKKRAVAASRPRASAPVQQEPPPPPPQPVQTSPPPAAEPPKPTEPEPPKPRKVEIPVGTTLAVRLIDPIDTEVNQTGETFRASLDAPVHIDGEEAIPQGADVRVRIAEARSAGRMAGRAEVRLELAWLEFQGRRYTLNTNQYEQVGRSEGKRTATTIGATTAVGAVIGAIAGGGKGAAIGAAAGAGAGTAASAATKGKQIKLASETLLEFRLESPFTVVVMPGETRPRFSRP